jgi:hypothetical protein
LNEKDTMRNLTALAVSVICAASAVWAVPAKPMAAADPLTVVTLSSRPDLVSGGDALVEIRSAAGATAKVTVSVNDRDATAAFRADAARKSLVGLVDGLKVGKNTIVAKAGAQVARLEVTNYPITGPILSGDHLTPFACNTVASGLGEPTAEQVQQLRQVFPGGVCDYSKAGVNQVRLGLTYQKLPLAAPGRSSTTSAQR